MLTTLGQGHLLLDNAPHSLNTTISMQLPRSWAYCCFLAHYPLLLGGLVCCLGWQVYVYVEIYSFLAQTSVAGNHLCSGQRWVIPGKSLHCSWGQEGLTGTGNWLSCTASEPMTKVLAMVEEMRASYLEAGTWNWSKACLWKAFKAEPGFRFGIMKLNVRKLSNVSNWVPNQQSQQYECTLQTECTTATEGRFMVFLINSEVPHIRGNR